MISNEEIRSTFTNFIKKIIVNESINYSKKVSLTNKAEVSLNNIFIDEKMSLSIFDDDIFYAFNRKIDYKTLENELSNPNYFYAMKTLSDRQKLILYLTIIEELSIKEVAKIIGTSENNISSSKTQAIKKFINNIKEEDDRNE